MHVLRYARGPLRARYVCLLVLAACKAKSEAPAAATDVRAAPVASAPTPKEADAGQRGCAKLTPAPLATCGTNVVKTPVPAIEDATSSLGAFFERLAVTERVLAGGPKPARFLRIAVYGDSNLTSDFLTGHLRRTLQSRWGDAGHGWISLSRPWGSYRHEDVVMAGFWPMFKLYAPTTHLVGDKQYGFANMAAQSREIGAAAWAGTTKDAKAVVGRSVASFELHYLKQPYGGSFRVEIDRKEVREVSTRATAFEAGIETFDVEDGPHEIRAVVRGDGPVRWFGTSLDRPQVTEGVQIDSLGAGALQFERLGWVAPETRRVQLDRRAYDLVVVWLGMNVMFVPPNRQYVKDFIGALREALPKTPILLLSPGDTVKDGATKSDPRIVSVVKQIREVAAESNVAFWDFREAMGGDGSILGFTKRGLTGADHIHFGPEGSRLMGDRLLCAVDASFRAWIEAHPTAGCSAP